MKRSGPTKVTDASPLSSSEEEGFIAEADDHGEETAVTPHTCVFTNTGTGDIPYETGTWPAPIPAGVAPAAPMPPPIRRPPGWRPPPPPLPPSPPPPPPPPPYTEISSYGSDISSTDSDADVANLEEIPSTDIPTPPPPPFAVSAAGPVSVPLFIPPPPSIPPPPPGPPPSGNSGLHCAPCDRFFRNAQQFYMHKEEDHVFCDFQECNWEGPPSMLLVHKIAHIKTGEGQDVLTSKDDNELWLRARRAARDKSGKRPEKLSVLENYIRSSVLRKTQKRRRVGESAVLPAVGSYWRFFDRKRSEALNGQSIGKPGVQLKSHEDFPICSNFLRYRKCKFGSECTRSHDIKGYKDWYLNKVKSGALLRRRYMNTASLIYQLHQSELALYETTLMKAFEALKENNFWQ